MNVGTLDETLPMSKRCFDILLSSLGLLTLIPLFLLLALFIKLDSAGPIFFQQERMGKGFQPFLILKFRTMIAGASAQDGPLTSGEDRRITRVGRLLRRTKIDELPQLVNVFRGEMSLVGPRPEVPRYVELFRKDFEEILCVRPGITDLASIKYRDESSALSRAANVEEEYLNQILPDKISLAKEYVRQSSFLVDLKLIVQTLLTILIGRRAIRRS